MKLGQFKGISFVLRQTVYRGSSVKNVQTFFLNYFIHEAHLFHRHATDYRYLQNTEGTGRQGEVTVHTFNDEKHNWK